MILIKGSLLTNLPALTPITNLPTINMYGSTASDCSATPTTAIALLTNNAHLRPIISANSPAGNEPTIPPNARMETAAAHCVSVKL